MNIHLRYCKKCREAFDIATNYEICLNCRKGGKSSGEEKYKKTS